MLVTNRGKLRMLEWVFDGRSLPSTFYVALCTAATVPTVDTNTLSDLTECPAGNGYTSGGKTVAIGTGFDSPTEDDSGDKASLQLVDQAWTASGGNLPTTAARYMVLTDDNATVADREVIAVHDLGSGRQVSNGQTLTIQDAQLDAKQPA